MLKGLMIRRSKRRRRSTWTSFDERPVVLWSTEEWFGIDLVSKAL